MCDLARMPRIANTSGLAERRDTENSAHSPVFSPTPGPLQSPSGRAPASSTSFRDLAIVVVGLIASGTAFGADAAPKPEGQSQAALIWVWGAVGAAVGANALFSFWRNLTQGLKIDPPPASTYQTQQLCRQKHDEMWKQFRGLAEEIRAVLATHEKRDEERSAGVHKRVDELLICVHAQRGQIENHIEHHPGKSA
jgi:hypothetical protein